MCQTPMWGSPSTTDSTWTPNFFVPSCPRLIRGILLSTENCWLPTWWCVISISAGGQGVPHPYRPQVSHLCSVLSFRAVVSQATAAALLPSGAHGRHTPCGQPARTMWQRMPCWDQRSRGRAVVGLFQAKTCHRQVPITRLTPLHLHIRSVLWLTVWTFGGCMYVCVQLDQRPTRNNQLFGSSLTKKISEYSDNMWNDLRIQIFSANLNLYSKIT